MTNFAKDVSSSYADLQAYRSGAIDQYGNLLKPESSIDPYEYFVIKIKRIFEELPPGMTKARLSSYLPALMVFSEEVQKFGITKEQFNFFVEGHVSAESNCKVSYLELLEDMGTGGGAGSIGTPVQSNNTGGVSGFEPVMGQMQRRKSVLGFENSCEMFDVCPQDYDSMKQAKAWRHVPEGETRNTIQRWERRNPGKKIAIRNTDTGELHWLNLKNKTLEEDVTFSLYDYFLNEQKSLEVTDMDGDDMETTDDVIELLVKDSKDNTVQDNSVKKSNAKKEQVFYDAMKKLLTDKGFVHNENATSAKDLKIGEFGTFAPASGEEDIVVAHDLGGKEHRTSIDTKYQGPSARPSKSTDVIIPKKTRVSPTIGDRTRRVRAWAAAKIFGKLSDSGKRKDIRGHREEITKLIPEILDQKGGLIISGNNERVQVIHNTGAENEGRSHDAALLGHLGLDATHEPGDLSKSGSPYIGNVGRVPTPNDPGGGENLRIRVSAPRHVTRNGNRHDTFESQKKNAGILKIPELKDIIPE